MLRQFKTIIVGSLGIFILSGCSSKYPVTFDSIPQGASLVCDGRNWGYTPITLYLDREKLKGMNSIPVNCSANWISGATSNYPASIPLDRFPNGVRATAQRPNVPGYEKDAQFALQVQNMRYQRRQAAAAEEANNQRAWDSLNRSIQNMNTNMNWQNTNFQLQQMNNYLRYGF